MDIRNFVIISHVDHGKSTLADRFLELTGTIEKRKMREQFLDQMELERERGITIKMVPVRMIYHPQNQKSNVKDQNDKSKFKDNPAERDTKILNFDFCILNLIDTPGHADFSYEVSRALAAVEGAILLVDGTQGIQAQTVAHLNIAKSLNLKIIPAINKIDLNPPNVDELIEKVAELVGTNPEEILKISAKTGYNVEQLLDLAVEKIPPPLIDYQKPFRALIFDSFYDNHRGVVAYVRVKDGFLKKDDKMWLMAEKMRFECQEIGFFTPELKPEKELKSGEIGYIATGIKDARMIKIGDTICSFKERERIIPLAGYQEPQRVIFASIWPENADDFENLRSALAKLQLNDSAFTFEAEKNEVLGRGFRVGFLGLLHLEITIERLKKEYKLEVLTTAPSVVYKIKLKNNKTIEICSAIELPEENEIAEIKEPIAHLTVTLPEIYFNQLFQLQEKFRMRLLKVENVLQNAIVHFEIPLQELILDFNDELKNISHGYATMSYEISGYQKVVAVKLEILVAGETVPSLTAILPKEKIEPTGRSLVKKLKEILPRQLFSVAIQAKVNNRIIARETLPALKKDVTGYLYGGDRSRKMKLWQKQKRGKKRLKSIGRISIPPDVYKKILSK